MGRWSGTLTLIVAVCVPWAASWLLAANVPQTSAVRSSPTAKPVFIEPSLGCGSVTVTDEIVDEASYSDEGSSPPMPPRPPAPGSAPPPTSSAVPRPPKPPEAGSLFDSVVPPLPSEPGRLPDEILSPGPGPATSAIGPTSSAGSAPSPSCRGGCAQPFRLFNGCFFQKHCINAGGWLQQGITLDANEPADRFNGPLATNDRDGEYQMNQLWLFFERPTDTSACGWDLGGRIDLAYGSDFRFYASHGLEDDINALDQYYGLMIPQMYAEVAVNRLTVKLGHFAGILSYESVCAPTNFFYSHSYAMIYGEPLLVTGVLGNYCLAERLSVTAGMHRGWMQFEDTNDNLDFMGGVTWTSCDRKTCVGMNLDVGPQDAVGQQDQFVYTLLFQRTMTPRLRYVMEHNLGVTQNGDPRTQGDADWYGMTNYFFYQLAPKWTGGLRFEWFRDQDGSRVAGVGNVAPGHGWPALPGFAGSFYETSLGLNWQPRPNVRFRPEARWDWYHGTTNLEGELPFDDGNRDQQFTLAADLLITF